MDRARLADWNLYRQMKAVYPEAAERGRLLAASRMADDPEARKRVENAYGIEFCRKMYPEVYKSGFIKLLNKVWKLLPW